MQIDLFSAASLASTIQVPPAPVLNIAHYQAWPFPGGTPRECAQAGMALSDEYADMLAAVIKTQGGTQLSSDGVQGCYRHEMTDEQHLELLAMLKGLQGMVVLSGYPSELYERELSDWQVHTTGSRISAGRGTAVKTEVLWLNAACQQRLAAPPAVQQALEI